MKIKLAKKHCLNKAGKYIICITIGMERNKWQPALIKSL
jgi:hypothetical protein